MKDHAIYYDFYWNGRKIRRFLSEIKANLYAQKMHDLQEKEFAAGRPANLTIYKIERKKLSTGKEEQKQ